MTPDEAIEKARWYEREDIATTLREEANVLADEVERLRERVARLEELATSAPVPHPGPHECAWDCRDVCAERDAWRERRRRILEGC